MEQASRWEDYGTQGARAVVQLAIRGVSTALARRDFFCTMCLLAHSIWSVSSSESVHSGIRDVHFIQEVYITYSRMHTNGERMPVHAAFQLCVRCIRGSRHPKEHMWNCGRCEISPVPVFTFHGSGLRHQHGAGDVRESRHQQGSRACASFHISGKRGLVRASALMGIESVHEGVRVVDEGA